MKTISDAIKRLDEIIAHEGREPLDQLGSYIVGAFIANEQGFKLYQENEKVAQIAELGSNLEISNGDEKMLQDMWGEVKRLTNELRSQ